MVQATSQSNGGHIKHPQVVFKAFGEIVQVMQ
jgi:hypothetical protein